MNTLSKGRKVVVIGAGSVGTTYVYTLMQTGLAGEIVLIDLDQKRLKGEIMDLEHGLAFVQPVEIRSGDYADCADANLIVVTAGAKQVSGQSRLELTKRNADIIKSICDEIKKWDSDAVLVMVANPVDALTQVALHRLGWPRERVIGSGTVLDSARFRSMLSRHCKIDTRNVHAYVLGEHGDSEVAAWSLTHVAGVLMKDYCIICQGCDPKKQHEDITRRVRDSAYHIIDYKGSTYYAIGLSLARISGAILRDEHSILTISILLHGEYDIDGICLSVPCVVGKAGVERIITAQLDADEHAALKGSAQTLRKVLEQIDI
ncbi:MAG: L-lactate dehydrogenase [Sedimentisphaerales bacterium]|nr:L-lactate dehydrogenase [Sedimentisphaerales bacterium]